MWLEKGYERRENNIGEQKTEDQSATNANIQQ